jgi:xylulokinase
LVPPDTDWAKISRSIEPNPRNRELYDNLYATWLQLYPDTHDVVHRLADQPIV